MLEPLAGRRVELVQYGGGVTQYHLTCGRQGDAFAATLQELVAGGAFERGDLAGDGGLCVAERGGRRGEGPALRHLAEHPQGDQ